MGMAAAAAAAAALSSSTAYFSSSIKTAGGGGGIARRRSFNIYYCSTFHINGTDDDEQVAAADNYPMSMTTTKRRHFFLQLGVGLFSLPLITAADSSSSSSFLPLAAAAAETQLAADVATQDFRLYSDDMNKFKILIPPDWQVGSGEGDGIRSLTAFYPPDPSVASSVSLVITGLGADFTRLESFGNVDAFAENLIGGLDRSWQRPPGVTAKLVNSKSANGLYYIDYTLQNPGESRKHLFSVLGIANNGWYNRLYTLTGQFVDEEADKYGPAIEKAVASFRLI